MDMPGREEREGRLSDTHTSAFTEEDREQYTEDTERQRQSLFQTYNTTTISSVQQHTTVKRHVCNWERYLTFVVVLMSRHLTALFMPEGK